MTIEQLETAIAAAKKDGAVDVTIEEEATINFHNGRGQRVGYLDEYNEEYISFLRKAGS